jgi:cysteine desulfurase
MDHAATTPLDSRVLDAMLPFLSGDFGNPSSVHRRGRIARNAVEWARATVANALSVDPANIIFTSGGTESNNLALLGLDLPSGRIISTRAEHEAVLRPLEKLLESNVSVQWCPVGIDGALSESALEMIGTAEPGSLITVMFVNNETGAVNDMRRIAEIGKSRGCIIHSDAVQAAGLFDLDAAELGLDMLTLSAHKIYGPKGVGCLFVNPDIRVSASILGGPQERDRRGGTENVAAIVGFARALQLAVEERIDRREHVALLHRRLRRGLEQRAGDAIRIVTGESGSSPHILSLVVPPVDDQPVDGEMLLLSLDVAGLEVSAGSACSSGSLTPSHVLSAAGWTDDEARASVRFSLGATNTAEEVDRAVDVFASVLNRMTRQRSVS